MTEKSSPIHSMTGFGRADSVIQNVPLQVEIKSVNHRYCEVKVRMPKELSHLEPKIRREIQSHVNRGRVELFFRFATENQEFPTQPDINMSLANQYIALYKQLAETAEQPNTKVDPAVIFQMPGVITQVSATEDIDSWSEPLLDTMRQALVPFLEMRKQEGQHLHQDIRNRLEAIVERLNTIESLTPELPQKQFDKLCERLAKFSLPESIDEQRLHQEVAIWSDRYDITEEVTRSRSHIEQFHNLLEQGSPIGRQLDFLCQELNREANTIGSKNQDAGIANEMIALKSEIEKIREQVQNIE